MHREEKEYLRKIFVTSIAEIVYFRKREGNLGRDTDFLYQKKKAIQGCVRGCIGTAPPVGRFALVKEEEGEIGKCGRGIRQMWRRGDGTRTLFGKKRGRKILLN